LDISSEQLPGVAQFAARQSSIAPSHFEARLAFEQWLIVLGHFSAFAPVKDMVSSEKPARHALHAGVTELAAVAAVLLAWAFASGADESSGRQNAAAKAQNFLILPLAIFPLYSVSDYSTDLMLCK
jgi:hypothetical protein